MHTFDKTVACNVLGPACVSKATSLYVRTHTACMQLASCAASVTCMSAPPRGPRELSVSQGVALVPKSSGEPRPVTHCV